MKKITGVLKAKGFEDCNFEFYVDDNMTEKQIEMEVYQRAGFFWTGRKKVVMNRILLQCIVKRGTSNELRANTCIRCKSIIHYG